MITLALFLIVWSGNGPLCRFTLFWIVVVRLLT